MRRLWGSGAHIKKLQILPFVRQRLCARGECAAYATPFSTPVNSEPKEACQFFHEDWFSMSSATATHECVLDLGFMCISFIQPTFIQFPFPRVLLILTSFFTPLIIGGLFTFYSFSHLNGEINLHAWVCHFEPSSIHSCTEQFDILLIPLPKDIHTHNVAYWSIFLRKNNFFPQKDLRMIYLNHIFPSLLFLCKPLKWSLIQSECLVYNYFLFLFLQSFQATTNEF